MKKIVRITGLLLILLVAYGCPTEEPLEANFEDTEDKTIFNFLEENDSIYGNFFKILDAAGVSQILSAYNPYNEGYTLFLPDSFAVEDYIAESPEYNSLQDLLNDTEFVKAMARYHVVNLAIDANDFPFGALPASTLSKDFLTVSFVVENDSSFYKINNQAPVIKENIEMSNGFIHILSSVLRPITYTTYDWLSDHDEYSIFKEAVDATGFDELLDIDTKDELNEQTPVTLFVEADSVFNMSEIYTLADLVAFLEVEGTDYENPSNDLYQFVGYHIIDANNYLDDFYDNTTNYTTFSNLPLNINGDDYIDITINKFKYAFDTIIEFTDTTIVDYVTFYYDQSNINSLSGAIHLIDHVMTLVPPSQATKYFSLWEEPFISNLRNQEEPEPGEYVFEEPEKLRVLSWIGPDPIFVISGDEEHRAGDKDFILAEGSFDLFYKLPKIVQGEYEIHINANCYDPKNTHAVVELYLDGSKVGGFADLSFGGSENYSYSTKLLGTVDLATYEAHEVELRALIPGRFEFDWVRFTPVKD